MASALSPQMVLIAYWAIVLVIAAFSLRMACSICRTDIPSWTPPQQAVAKPPSKAQARAAKRRPAHPKAAQPGAVAPGKPEDSSGEPSSLQVFQQQAEEAVKGPREYLVNAAGNLKEYADSQLDDLKEATEPVTKHLPERVQNFLDQNGWYWILGACGVLALLWV